MWLMVKTMVLLRSYSGVILMVISKFWMHPLIQQLFFSEVGNYQVSYIFRGIKPVGLAEFHHRVPYALCQPACYLNFALFLGFSHA